MDVVQRRKALADALSARDTEGVKSKQSVESEMLSAEDGTATLTTRRVEVLRTLWWSHHVSSRWNETWKRIGGEWLLLEETPNLAMDWA
jgi:hypothetical protein